MMTENNGRAGTERGLSFVCIREPFWVLLQGQMREEGILNHRKTTHSFSTLS
jgi:hypothetical protein